MRDRARGILIEDGYIVLMHRIKDGRSYYVIPGGGLEGDETLSECVIREVYEEAGVLVRVVLDKPLYVVNMGEYKNNFMVVEKVSGVVGTGVGEEYQRVDRGVYKIEKVKLSEVISGKIDLVPEEFSLFFKKILSTKNVEKINSCDLV